jgi:acyl-CoA thioesterase FadM
VNHIFRLLWLALVSRFRSRVPATGPCRTPFRVLPTDLDVLRHVNNGVYLSLMDLGRVDLMARAGLAEPIRRSGWYPVVVAETIQFRRSLTLFERFTIVTSVLGWDEKAFLLEQRFERAGETIALALVRARFLARAGGNVTPAQILALAGELPALPPIPEHAARWNADVAVWRERVT